MPGRGRPATGASGGQSGGRPAPGSGGGRSRVRLRGRAPRLHEAAEAGRRGAAEARGQVASRRRGSNEKSWSGLIRRAFAKIHGAGERFHLQKNRTIVG
jgi:hypothetical protein